MPERTSLAAAAVNGRPLVRARGKEKLGTRFAKGPGTLLPAVGAGEHHCPPGQYWQHEVALLHARGPGSGNCTPPLHLADCVPGRRGFPNMFISSHTAPCVLRMD